MESRAFCTLGYDTWFWDCYVVGLWNLNHFPLFSRLGPFFLSEHFHLIYNFICAKFASCLWRTLKDGELLFLSYLSNNFIFNSTANLHNNINTQHLFSPIYTQKSIIYILRSWIKLQTNGSLHVYGKIDIFNIYYVVRVITNDII